MEAVVIKNNLKNSLSIIERASGENLKLPILKYGILEVADNQIKLIATNLEVAITYLVPGKVIEKGKTSVPINTFINLINNLESERLNLEKQKGQLKIKTDNYEASLQTLPVEDFPIIPRVKNENEYLEIEASIFKDALKQVVVATQFSEFRPELNSVLFDFSLETLKLAATDSFRLAEKTITSSQFKTNHADNFRILVPLKTSQELLRVLKDDEILRIYHDKNQILFKTQQLEFISQLQEGNFPDYRTIIPPKFDSEIILEREKFINALKLAGIFSARSSEVKIKVPEGKKIVEISSASQEVGENHYLLPAKTQKKLEEVTFNWRYLVDGLKVLKTTEVFLGVNEEEKKPTLVKSPNEASYFYIVMPILKT